VANPAAASTSGARRLPLSVAWVGPRPVWLELDEAKVELEGVEFCGLDTAKGQVVHVTRAALEELGELRKALPRSVIVLDLTAEGDTELTGAESRHVRGSESLFAGSRWELGELIRRLSLPLPDATVVTRPLDLDWYAPEPRLAETKGRGRDFHRLAGPIVLFAGPYTEAGGLDLLVETVFRLRERISDLRLAAIPHGPTDPRYRDRCEMRILGLGHHGIVEWDAADSEIPFWYATAAVVCCPSRAETSSEPAKRAAAAARPDTLSVPKMPRRSRAASRRCSARRTRRPAWERRRGEKQRPSTRPRPRRGHSGGSGGDWRPTASRPERASRPQPPTRRAGAGARPSDRCPRARP
jgi:hypothetical protein